MNSGELRVDRVLVRVLGLFAWVGLLGLMESGSLVQAEELTPAKRGYENLRTHAYLPPDLDDDVFNALWTVWSEPERGTAEAADPAERRNLTFSYYGLMSVPGEGGQPTTPLGYIVDPQGNWSMNCLACHGGKVAGKVIPGLPNSHTALQTLSEDIRRPRVNTDAAQREQRHDKRRRIRDCARCFS